MGLLNGFYPLLLQQTVFSKMQLKIHCREQLWHSLYNDSVSWKFYEVLDAISGKLDILV